jgi:hypothetical protein
MKPQASVDNLTNYANSGGKIFASTCTLLDAAQRDVQRDRGVHRQT